MAKKRLEKQLHTTYKLFRTINPELLPDILRSYQNLDCRLNYDEMGEAVDFSIYDKSGFVLKSGDIARDIGILENPELFESKYTQMYAESEQMELELQRCIEEAYRSSYRDSCNQTLFSEHMDRMPINAMLTEMARSERFRFFRKYLHTNNQHLNNLIQK